MKTRNSKMRSIGIFALALVLLTTTILPLTASGSEPGCMGTYVVKSGDSLASISASHGVTVASIVDANGISASAKLYEGQRLLIPGATSVEDDSTTVFGASSYISINFKKDSDLVGVLETIVAHTGYTIIFKGATQAVPAISLDNVTPLTAIDYVLRMVDMTYIKNDNIIYVGTAETLNSSFIDNKALTSFRLKYISIETLTAQLSALGISPKMVKIDENIREFWVSAYPMELAKIRELIKTLDNKTNLTLGSANISSSLSAIELEHISANEFSALLSSLGLHAGITTESHPMTLYVYASGDAYQDILNIKKLVDFEDANAPKKEGEGTEGGEGSSSEVEITDGETSLVKVDLQYINKDAAESIVTTFGYDVEILGLDLYEKRVWVRGSVEEVNDAVARIKENDTPDNNTAKTFFTYELQNIVASELQSKIGFVDLDGVEFYFGSYPQLTKSIMVYCSTNKVDEVKKVIASLDSNLGDMYYPIATITDANELSVLAAKEELVVKLINNPTISVTSFEISGDLDPSDEGVKYILYVLESPENIDLIAEMWSKIA
ncbi:MAG: LysM peptidoglycan-binding domain-containing protein [Clostridia bacterium]|nr:LysM peptidoglycan-binding domain-containing protein [Clostridia bacterium]